MRSRDPAVLLEQAARGDRAALGRLLSIVEREDDMARVAGRAAFALGGSAYTVGITGAPGAGKSTLTDRLVRVVRSSAEPVAVLGVDPSSPFSGGAILGDRVRMSGHFLDAGVYIRSMATRGRLGGLALATPQAVRVLDAVGFPWIIVETVGVGQVEIDIARAADTTVVVVNPGWGDAVQAAKAGLLEIADVLVVNKADRPGADETRADLGMMRDLSARSAGTWRPPVVLTSALDGAGAEDVWQSVRRHRAHAEADGTLAQRRAERLAQEVRGHVQVLIETRVAQVLSGDHRARLDIEMAAGRLDPFSVAEELLERLLG